MKATDDHHISLMLGDRVAVRDYHHAMTPVPIIPDHVVDTLRLRPWCHDTRTHVPGKLVGYWRSHADASIPEAGGPYRRLVVSTQQTIEAERAGTARSFRYLSDADLRPFGGSREAYFVAEIARDKAKAEAWASLPWPGEHIDLSMLQDERERVAALLDAAPVVASYCGFSNDRLNPDARVLNGSGDRAAAGWIWPEGLSHYVRTYGLVLPPEMIANLSDAGGMS